MSIIDINLGQMFEELARPNERGFSEPIDVKNIYGQYEQLNVTNGSSYSRGYSEAKNQVSYLYNKYYLIKQYERGYLNTETDNRPNAGVGMGSLLTIKLNGFR